MTIKSLKITTTAGDTTLVNYRPKDEDEMYTIESLRELLATPDNGLVLDLGGGQTLIFPSRHISKIVVTE